MRGIITSVFEPGFFASQQVHIALTIGAVVAIVSAITGTFTVMRSQSFAGHSLGDVSAAGGSGALLIGLSPVAGFVGLGVLGAGVMDLIGVQRVRGRDLATGIVLGAAIGLSALFLYLNSISSATTGATQQILFGSIFSTTATTTVAVAILGGVALASLAVICRPLLLATVSPDMAVARGVRLRLIGLAYMLALAVSVGLSALAIGAILSTALLIGPAATALRLTRTVTRGMIAACLIGIAATWLGILLAYDSYDWEPSHKSLPVSFFIVAVIFAGYLAAGLPAVRARTSRRATVPSVSSGRAGPTSASKIAS